MKNELSVMPKNFRVWDKLHKRWFQGKPTDEARKIQTDCVHYFGEVLIMEGTLFDKNEDDAWKESPEINSSLDLLEYLTVVQDTGMTDREGRRIFEGDLLELKGSGGYVDYDQEAGAYYLKNNRWSAYPNLSQYKIVGNIFENPEKLAPLACYPWELSSNEDSNV